MSRSEALVIAGPVGALEARLELPAGEPTFIALMAHPHPLHGGTMENKVVTTVCRCARDHGGAALRFNYRGVGASEGSFDQAVGETEDARAALAWLRERYPGLPIWLGGFSFGSYVAARVAQGLAMQPQRPAHLLLVAPPVHNYDFDSITATGCPVTVLQGDEDEVVPVEQVFDWLGRTPLTPHVRRFPATGHFFHGHLVEMKEALPETFPA